MWVYQEQINGKNLTDIINAKNENVKYLPVLSRLALTPLRSSPLLALSCLFWPPSGASPAREAFATQSVRHGSRPFPHPPFPALSAFSTFLPVSASPPLQPVSPPFSPLFSSRLPHVPAPSLSNGYSHPPPRPAVALSPFPFDGRPLALLSLVCAYASLRLLKLVHTSPSTRPTVSASSHFTPCILTL
eukprot:5318686-Pleurochrysis_carterae.AAC.1